MNFCKCGGIVISEDLGKMRCCSCGNEVQESEILHELNSDPDLMGSIRTKKIYKRFLKELEDSEKK